MFRLWLLAFGQKSRKPKQTVGLFETAFEKAAFQIHIRKLKAKSRHGPASAASHHPPFRICPSISWIITRRMPLHKSPSPGPSAHSLGSLLPPLPPEPLLLLLLPPLPPCAPAPLLLLPPAPTTCCAGVAPPPPAPSSPPASSPAPLLLPDLPRLPPPPARSCCLRRGPCRRWSIKLAQK